MIRISFCKHVYQPDSSVHEIQEKLITYSKQIWVLLLGTIIRRSQLCQDKKAYHQQPVRIACILVESYSQPAYHRIQGIFLAYTYFVSDKA